MCDSTFMTSFFALTQLYHKLTFVSQTRLRLFLLLSLISILISIYSSLPFTTDRRSGGREEEAWWKIKRFSKINLLCNFLLEGGRDTPGKIGYQTSKHTDEILSLSADTVVLHWGSHLLSTKIIWPDSFWGGVMWFSLCVCIFTAFS